MLVEMVKMRQSGRKCTREQLRAQPPIRGELSIYLKREMLMAAVLPDKRLPDDIPSLEEPRLTRMRGDSFVLVGYETLDLRRSDAQRYLQAWWCRLAAGAPSSLAAQTGGGASGHPIEAASVELVAHVR